MASVSGMGHVEVVDLPLTEENGATVGEDRDGGHLLTVDEVALRLCVSRNWVYNHASEIGAYRLGKYLRFSWSRVLERLGR
jgi:excisionase family DNA binding protein